jgi:O-antigen ligase
LQDFGYEALNVGVGTRPFSTFASSAEHVLFLAVAIVVWLAFGLRRGALPTAAPAIALLAVSLFLASTRGAVFAAAIAVGGLVFARLRIPPLPAAVGAAAVVLLVPAIAERLAPNSYGAGEVDHLVAHQVEGLADPLSSESSTLGLHLGLALDGFSAAASEPLGIGVGPITNATMRLGGQGQTTELDPSNVAVALGLPGLVAYTAVLVIGLTRAYQGARSRRDALSLIALGVLAATLFQWLNGGLYLVAMLSWLALGWVDRPASSKGGTA